MPGKMNMPGGGDSVRHMRVTEKQARVSHSQQILAPTFQLLGNLQICSGHLGSGRLGKGGSMQEGGLQEDWAGEGGLQRPGILPNRQLVNSLTQFALTLHLYLYFLHKSFCRRLGVVPGNQL